MEGSAHNKGSTQDMRRMLLVLSLLTAAVSAHAETCDGCTAAGEARHRPVQSQHGGPVSSDVCVYVAMPDPCDSVAVERDDASGKTVIRDYGLGAAVNNAQSRPFKLDAHGKQIVTCTGGEKAMVCMPREALGKSTTLIRLIPGNKGSCYVLPRPDLDELLKSGSWGPDREVHLGWEHAGKKTAPVGFKTLRQR